MKTLIRLLVLSLALLAVSCKSGHKKQAGNDPCDSLKDIYKLKVITSLDDMKAGDSAIFKAPNGKCYVVVSDKTQMEAGENESLKNDNKTTSAEKPCGGDKFTGKERRATKTSITNAATQTYEKLSSFINSLQSDENMGKTHEPAISTDTNSKRVDEERRNVHIKKAWIYAFSKQDDNDYHLLIGDTPDKLKSVFFDVEISALPGKRSYSYKKLDMARKDFKEFFNLKDTCKAGDTKKFITPIEIEFAGSLFFDKWIYDSKSKKNFEDLITKTCWEIHPISKIKFD